MRRERLLRRSYLRMSERVGERIERDMCSHADVSFTGRRLEL